MLHTYIIYIYIYTYILTIIQYLSLSIYVCVCVYIYIYIFAIVYISQCVYNSIYVTLSVLIHAFATAVMRAIFPPPRRAEEIPVLDLVTTFMHPCSQRKVPEVLRLYGDVCSYR